MEKLRHKYQNQVESAKSVCVMSVL